MIQNENNGIKYQSNGIQILHIHDSLEPIRNKEPCYKHNSQTHETRIKMTLKSGFQDYDIDVTANAKYTLQNENTDTEMDENCNIRWA